ncbi:MAG: hypothetical protein GF383_07255 [Candidatus Lokiarchaeota archaeon]|nr:hypothetical protein [Candidatus Lokiarchaeota archaeon]MBD3339965.1 hypothetical protein [Candidatus Lokiarchaeota archaeon]
MVYKNGILRIHPSVLERYEDDECMDITVSTVPLRGSRNSFLDSPAYLKCGVCGKRNVKLIHHTAGATFDGTVEVKEVQCLDCECFTLYFWSDRM